MSEPEVDLVERARLLLAGADAGDPGFRNTPPFSLNERQGKRERTIAKHYAAYGMRHVLFELFPDLEAPPASPREEPGDERKQQ